MQMRTIQSLPRPVSALCLGTALFGSNVSRDDAFRLMDRFAEAGGNLFDTARLYGGFGQPGGRNGLSEETLAAWIRSRGMEKTAVVVTKGAHPPMENLHGSRVNEACLRADIRESTEVLGPVAGWLLHRDDPRTPVAEIMETLNEYVRSGLIGAVGVSNWTPERIREANGYAAAHGLTGFTVDEPQFSLARVRAFRDDTLVTMGPGLYTLHRETGMLCLPFTSQALGFFPKLLNGGVEAVRDSEYFCPENLAVAERMRVLSKRTGLSPNAIGLCYLMGQPFPVIPIVGPNRMETLEAALDAADASLTPEEIEGLCPSSRFEEV